MPRITPTQQDTIQQVITLLPSDIKIIEMVAQQHSLENNRLRHRREIDHPRVAGDPGGTALRNNSDVGKAQSSITPLPSTPLKTQS